MRRLTASHRGYALGLLILIASGFWATAHGQNPEWQEYYALPYRISAIADAGDYLWLAEGSIYKFHKATGTWQRYTKLPAAIGGRWIVDMAVHPQGHLWVGLDRNRVWRFDGTSWNVYDLPTPYAVYIHRVYLGAGTNEVWLGTNQGLWRFNNGSWTHYNTQNSGLPSDNVEDVLMDGQGRLWVATWSGLAQFNGTSWTVFTSQNTPNFPSSTSIKRLALDNQGRLWVLAWDGLARYDGNNWLGYALPAGFYVSCMGIAPNGHVWLAGSGSAFLVRFDGTSWQTFNSQNTLLPITQASSLVVDAQGRLWFFGRDEDSPYLGQRRKGLIRYDGISWTIFRDTYNGLPFDFYIDHLLIDSQSRIWLSLRYPDYGRNYDYYHALVSFDRSTWRVYDNWNSGLPNALIRGLVMDRQGRLWIATEGAGLVRFDGTSWVSIRASSTTFPNDTLTAIHLDPQNRLWVGSIKGLSRFDGSTWTHYTTLNSGLPDNEVWTIATDTRGRLWVGTEKGVARWDGNTWATYTTLNSNLPSNEVWRIISDGQGGVWMVTGGGLVRTDGSTWQVYNTLNSGLPADYVTALTLDGTGRLWVGTENAGVARFDGTNWTYYNETNSGLPSNYVSALAIDPADHKWIATYAGLAVFREGGVNLSLPLAEASLRSLQAYPNPCSEEVTVSFSMAVSASVTLSIMDLTGQVLLTQTLGPLPAGDHWVPLSLRNLASGTYLLQLKMPLQSETLRLLVTKP